MNRTIAATLAATAALAPLSHHAAACPSKGSGSLDAIVTKWVNDNQPGVAFGLCAVALDGHGNEGFACSGGADNSHGLTKDTLFQIGSLTKTFTAELFADRVVPGFYHLDSFVDPHLAAKYRLGTALDKVTMLQLATHHSGLPRDPSSLEGSSGDFDQLDTLVTAAHGHLDTGYLYSNFAFQILGYTIADDDGMSWMDDISLSVTSPLGMEDTMNYNAWQTYSSDDFDNRAATTHEGPDDWLGEGTGPASTCPTANPSGCLYSSPHDMRIWLQHAMGLDLELDDSNDPRRLLRKSYTTGDKSTTAQGLAWAFDENADTACGDEKKYIRVEKSGDVAGSHAWIEYLEDPKDPYGISPLGIVVFANSDLGQGKKLDLLGEDLLARLPF